MYLAFVVRSSHLMKRCTVGGGKKDCYVDDPCKTEDDCFSDLICNDGYCEHGDPGSPPCPPCK